MKKLLSMLLMLAASAAAQNLTPSQKEADFRYLASLYATYYAPADWKKQLFGVDILDIRPWLDKVAKTQTDLDFYEVCVDYVASLNDTHDRFSLTSDFVARLGFTVDIYDGALLIDSITRSLLPAASYPFTTGDELISIDGVDAQQILTSFLKYSPQGNISAARRLAAARLTTRSQSVMPHATSVGDSAKVVIRRQNGNSESYTIPWTKTGTPLTVGPVPSPKSVRQPAVKSSTAAREPDYTAPLRELQWAGVLSPEETGLNGYGSQSPLFAGGLSSFQFTRRLGASSADFFYSGTFKFFELTFGYIRIPSYSPPSTATALQTLDREIAYMNANTDGLIIDEMRNPGGSLCFGENVVQRLSPVPFTITAFETRAFWSRVVGFYNSMIAAKAANQPWEVIQQYELIYNELLAAAQSGRRVTNPIPLCTSSLTRQPVTDAAGNVTAYQKPIMLLIDEFSTSTADSVAGMLQDNNLAVLYGQRTNGAGGNNTNLDAGVFSEGITGMTLALQSRKDYFGVAGYPGTKYIENVGVPANVVEDYMTKDNLLRNGVGFIEKFLQAMAAYTRERKR